MSRAVRKKMLSMINLLEEANRVLKKHMTNGKINEETVMQLLADCQDTAAAIGNTIEELCGEGTESVSRLEEYCESLYQMALKLQDPAERREIQKLLTEQLKQIRRCVSSDIPDKLEVVFLPYKASMWDSLESVYLAMREDENYDTYCVPIPYFDLNPDHSFGEMHYEGGEYPRNIEVVDWESYHFENRLPDIIYIHNPYDNWNHVTSVHPRFYSKNLKQYTDKLVYIPYFVLNEIEPNDQERIDGMKHFCFLPGTIYADKVILQSENMRQIYINEYRKEARAKGLSAEHVDRKRLEEKFVGTGSPKFDKVLNTKKEELEIPEEWSKVIEKPDGTWKKIILYNTSIGALLKYDEKMLEKMRRVFSVFKGRQDEIALLWRPHPLIPSTIRAMRPQLWEEYEKIVDEYRAEGWGIYDDTADLDRAVLVSDAYYGDSSSVVQLYQRTEKPVMVQNVETI